MVQVILAAGVLVGLAVAVSLLRQSRWYQHRQLFRQLCRVHGLDRSSRRLLRRLEQQLRLPFPAWVFVDPRCLAAARKLPGIPPTQLLPLQAKLFGDLAGLASSTDCPKMPLPPDPLGFGGLEASLFRIKAAHSSQAGPLFAVALYRNFLLGNPSAV